MSWLGDFPEDFATVTVMFTTHDQTGAILAPSSAFEADDLRIYKNGNAAQKTTTNGVTMTSPFDTVTGLHCVVIDTSNDTGDGGFWVAGAVYTLVLVPDETVDSLAVVKVIGQFGIELPVVTLNNAQGYTRGVAVSKFMFPVFDASGNGLTGQTVSTRKISKDGAAEADITDTVTEVAGGWYEVDLSGTEMTADEIALRFASALSKTTYVKIRTVRA